PRPHQRGHAAHARLQALPRARRDRRDHRLSENRARHRHALNGQVERPRRNAMQTHQLRLVALPAATLVASGAAAPAAEHLLSGTVASAAGEKLGGVNVPAKAHRRTSTTSDYTHEQGGYHFPPRTA